jgi:uncharacterized delta-60 repeat protein
MKKILLCFMASLALLHAYSQAGSLDHCFAGKGWTASIFSKGNLYDEIGGQVLVQKDSNYIVVFEVNGYTVLTRYFKNGAMDTRFGTGGYSDPVPIIQPKAVLQRDGKIVVAGQAGGDFALARYNCNGSLDSSFDGDGKQTTDFFGDYDIASSLAIQPNGKIVVAGTTFNPNDRYSGDFAIARYNSNGTLDSSFDGDGKQTIDFGYSDYATSVATQTDGKIVVAGHASNPYTDDLSYFAIVRYNSNGSLDNSFDGEGIQTTYFFSGSSLAIQPDGKIVAAGQAFNPNTNNRDFALARYNSNGTLDSSFDGDGIQTTDFFGGDDFASSLAIQPDGKIVVAGVANNTNHSNFALARYNSNGSLDNSFSGDGKHITDFKGGNDIASSLAIQPDGKIVVAGQAFNPDANNSDFALARYNSNGSLDNSFDGDGKLTDFYLAGNTRFTAIAIQPDGKIIAAGQAFNLNTGNNDFALARYNSNGTLDSTFSGDGKLTTDFGFDEFATSLAIQGDGKIVVAGGVHNDGSNYYDFALARYNSNGSLDNSFDGDGKLTTDFFGSDDYATSLAIQTDGKIVAAGQAYNPNTTSYEFALARYNSNGSLDSSFDGDGMQTTDFGSDDYATSLAIQTDGKIVAAGQAYNSYYPANYDFALARYNSNGTLDSSFDGDGKLTTDFFGGNDIASSLAIQTDGKIVVAGQAFNPNTNNSDFALARYNSNGPLDNSFDGDGMQTTDFGWGEYANSLAIQSDGKIVVAGVANSDFALARYNSNGSLDSSFSGDGIQTTDLKGGNDYAAAVVIRNNRIYVAGSSTKFVSTRGIVAAYQTGTTTLAAPLITNVAPLKAPQPLIQQLTVNVLPNPSTQYFTLKLQSSGSTSIVTISITDAAGRLIEMKTNVNVNSSLQLGHNYPRGIYFAQIVKGNKKEVVKLIKQ